MTDLWKCIDVFSETVIVQNEVFWRNESRFKLNLSRPGELVENNHVKKTAQWSDTIKFLSLEEKKNWS